MFASVILRCLNGVETTLEGEPMDHAVMAWLILDAQHHD